MYGIGSLAINGSMSYDQRDKVVEKFKVEDQHRVLIFTKIGTVGLNLTVANVLILLVRIIFTIFQHSLTFSCRISNGPTPMKRKRLVASIAKASSARSQPTTFSLLVRLIISWRIWRGGKLRCLRHSLQPRSK